MHSRTLPATGLAFLLGIAGCSGTRPAAEMIELTGRVTVNGRPADKVIMNLTPVNPGEGREDDCVVHNGEYRLKVISAKYRVAFTQGPGGSKIPSKYKAVDSAQFILDGTKPEAVNFDLK